MGKYMSHRLGICYKNYVNFLVEGCHGCLCHFHLLYVFCWWIGDNICIFLPCGYVWRGPSMFFIGILSRVWMIHWKYCHCQCQITRVCQNIVILLTGRVVYNWYTWCKKWSCIHKNAGDCTRKSLGYLSHLYCWCIYFLGTRD